MIIFPNLQAAVQALRDLDDNEWLHVDEAEWQADPLTAPLYLFPEDEMEDLAAEDLAVECASGTWVPLAYAGREIYTLCDTGTLAGVVFNLAKYMPAYSAEQLLHALNHYLQYDDFYEAEQVPLQLHIWAGKVAGPDLHLLKGWQAAMDAALGYPPGAMWVRHNQARPIAALLYGIRLHEPLALAAAAARADLSEVNALYLLAADCAAAQTVQAGGMVYLGRFAATANPA